MAVVWEGRTDEQNEFVRARIAGMLVLYARAMVVLKQGAFRIAYEGLVDSVNGTELHRESSLPTLEVAKSAAIAAARRLLTEALAELTEV